MTAPILAQNASLFQAQNGKKCDLSTAAQFLSTLAGNKHLTFQTFDDDSQEKSLVKILHGTFEANVNELVRLNKEGAGIFVTVNETDGQGRKKENVVAVRAVFVDLDGAPLQPILESALPPQLIVESSPERYHAYWLVEGMSCEEFTPIQKLLASQFNGDPKVCDLSRVMRVPGFYHLKGDPFLTRIFREIDRPPYKRDEWFPIFGNQGEKSVPEQCQTAIKDNSILATLQKNKLLIRAEGSPPGCWTILCPWRHLHSKQDFGTKYFEPSAPDYPQGGFKCFHAHCADKTLTDLRTYLNLSSGLKNCEPLPLHRPLDNAKPFPFHSLGNILMPAALAMNRVIQAPDAVCAQSVLGAAALVCQPFANILIDGRTIPLSLFLLTVAESGERKSATDNAALKPITVWQKMLLDAYREENKRYVQDQEMWENNRKKWLKDEGVGSFTEDEPLQPLKPLILVEEPTYEGIVKYLEVGQPSVGLFSDEGARFFGGHAMGKDHLLKTLAGLSSIWDGRAISRLRGYDGYLLLYGRRVSLHLMVQEIILEQINRNQVMECQGFLPRCLVSFPASMAGSRPYREENLEEDSAICTYYQKLHSLLDQKPPVNPHPAPQNELCPHAMHLSASAKKEWVTYHNATDRDLACGGRLEPVKRLSNKAAEHVLRLAGNLTMIDQTGSDLIESDYIQRAIILMEYYVQEAMRIQGHLSIPQEILLAKKLLNWCQEKGQEVYSLQQIYQYGPPQIRQADKARRVLGILVDHGWLRPVAGVVIDNKSYREAWTIK